MRRQDSRLWSVCLLGAVVALWNQWPLAGEQRAGHGPRSPIVRLSPAQALQRATAARRGVSVQIASGLELTAWAPDGLVIDPVALDFDERGVLYATSTSRNNMPLDIRAHPSWVPLVHSLRTVPDLLAFYRRELAPERSAENPWLPDANNDGSRDWRDLARLTERLYRIEDTNGDGVADRSQIMIDGFNSDPTNDIAGGVLHHNGDWLLGASPALWRLRDQNGDGFIDSQVAISEGYNVHPAFGGHGMSGVTLGPDGRIYWEVGDMGFDVVDQSGRRWSSPNQGAVLRANPDGSDFEVFATGIRNLQEFAFDEYGNLISVDNDGDHPGETERLVYLTEGSDSGWRANWQYGKYTDPDNNRYNAWMDEGMFKPRFEGQPAHLTPPIAAYHPGPAGMAYEPGTALSDEWRRHFFVASFRGSASNAVIRAFRLRAEGAGFALESDRVLLQGILTVGMKFGPDGGLYLADWITGWDSKGDGRIWRVAAPGATPSAAQREVRSLLAGSLEARTATDVGLLLQHADMRVRLKAQFELVRRADITTLRSDRAPRRSPARADPQPVGHRPARSQGPAALDAPRGIPRPIPIPKSGRKPPGWSAMCAMRAPPTRCCRCSTTTRRGRGSSPPKRSAGWPTSRRSPPSSGCWPTTTTRDVNLRHAGSLALSRIGDASRLWPPSRVMPRAPCGSPPSSR